MSMVRCIGPIVIGPWSAVLALMLQVHGRLYWPKCYRSMVSCIGLMLQVHGQLYWPKCYRSMVGCIGPNVTGPWSAVLALMLQVHGQLYLPNCYRSLVGCIGPIVTGPWSAVLAHSLLLWANTADDGPVTRPIQNHLLMTFELI